MPSLHTNNVGFLGKFYVKWSEKIRRFHFNFLKVFSLINFSLNLISISSNAFYLSNWFYHSESSQKNLKEGTETMKSETLFDKSSKRSFLSLPVKLNLDFFASFSLLICIWMSRAFFVLCATKGKEKLFFRVRFPFSCLSIINLLFGSQRKQKGKVFCEFSHLHPQNHRHFDLSSLFSHPNAKIWPFSLFKPFSAFLLNINLIFSHSFIYRLEVSRTIIYFIIEW